MEVAGVAASDHEFDVREGEEERGGGRGQTSAPGTVKPVDTAVPPLKVFYQPWRWGEP